MNITELKQEATGVKNETVDLANTAQRIGLLFLAMIKSGAFPYAPTETYEVGILAIFEGKLVQSIAVCSPNQSPTTNPEKWNDFSAKNIADIQLNGARKSVDSKILANYVKREVDNGPASVSILPYADETNAGKVLKVGPNTLKEDNNTVFITPKYLFSVVQELIKSLSVSKSLNDVVNIGSITDVLLTLNGGVEAIEWESVGSSDFVFVPKVKNGKKRLALLPISALSTTGNPTTPPVLSYAPGIDCEIVNAIASVPAKVYTPGKDCEIVDAVNGAPLITTVLRFINLSFGSSISANNAELIWTTQNTSYGLTAYQLRSSPTGIAGSFSDPVNVNGGQLVFTVNQYNVSTFFQHRDYYTATRFSDWSNTVEVVIHPPAIAVLKAVISLHGVGSPPPQTGLITGGAILQATSEGQNIGLIITNEAGNIPTGEYDGLSFEMQEVGTTNIYGQLGVDYSAKPSAEPFYLFPRPDGFVFREANYILRYKVYKFGNSLLPYFASTSFSMKRPIANRPPIAPPDFVFTFNKGIFGSKTFPVFGNPDGVLLTYTVVERINNTGGFFNGSFSFNRTTLVFSGTPNPVNFPNTIAEVDLIFTATDSRGLSAFCIATLRVLPAS